MRGWEQTGLGLSRTFKIVLLVLALSLAAVAALMIWASNAVTDYPTPPRLDAPLDRAPDRSTLVTRATAPLAAVRDRLEKAVPRTLVRLDERVEECVPREEVRVAGLDLFKTPKLSCKLVGTITRGAITLGGSGRVLRARVPVSARIEVQDLGDIIKRETVTAAASVIISARLDVDQRWRLDPDVDLAYRWTTKPGTEVLGQRITFTKPADKALAKSLAKIERQIEGEIRTIDLRGEVEKVWREGHTTLSINREKPPVWMRLTPRELGAGALNVDGTRIATELMLVAEMQLEVGEQPEAPTPTKLGANIGTPEAQGFALNVPVLADFAQVEAVILRELKRLDIDQMLGEDIGVLEAEFRSVTVYATRGGKLAVGIDTKVTPSGVFGADLFGGTQGTVWLTATPVTRTGSEVLTIEGLTIYGDMDRYSGDLLISFLDRPAIKSRIESALVTDFRSDYQRIVGKAQEGLRSVKVGPAELSFEVEDFAHGAIKVTGPGLYLPVTASGTITTRLER